MRTHSNKAGNQIILCPDNMAEAFRLGLSLGTRKVKARVIIPEGPCSLKVIVSGIDFLQLALGEAVRTKKGK